MGIIKSRGGLDTCEGNSVRVTDVFVGELGRQTLDFEGVDPMHRAR